MRTEEDELASPACLLLTVGISSRLEQNPSSPEWWK